MPQGADAMPEPCATFVYDGDCGICRYWVEYWMAQTGAAVVYRPYQEAAASFPDIPVQDFERAVQFIETDGRVYAGAAATFRLLRHAPGRGLWWWLYAHAPGFAPLSERAYSFFSSRRSLLAVLSRSLWGPKLEPERYDLVSWIFLRLLGAIYLAAFASLAAQIVGLVGESGILPAGRYLEAARQGWGAAAYWRLPTLFWLSATDTALLAATVAGVAFSVLVILGIWVRGALACLFVLYLSCVYAGQAFTNYQWDQLLLEAGFLAIFLTAGSRIVVWLYRWLLFRFLLLSGVVKLLSGDTTWQSLTALKYHFWTQPLPTPLAWYAAQLPDRALAAATAATLVIELAIVFLIFMPRRLRAAAAWSALLFQLAILLTGNYGFFNLLTMALCIFLFDDAAVRRLLPTRIASSVVSHAPHPGRLATCAAAALALVVVPVGVNRIWHAVTHTNLPLAGALTEAVTPLQIANPYGPFATTTRTRPEIVIEGSGDGRTWREYVFRYKPGPVGRAPTWNIPHQPRLDWQMWFAAYGSFSESPWFVGLMHRLLEGSNTVLGLLAANPFPERPPKYIRAQTYDYRFTDADAREGRRGDWWVRRPTGIYFPQVTLADLSRMAPGLSTPP